MGRRDDILVLTKGDELNYRAICNFVAGRRVRQTAFRRIDDIVSPARKASLLHSQNYSCAHCGKAFSERPSANGMRFQDVTADHIIQYCYGGEANHHNIVLVHSACNLERAANYSLKDIEQHYGPINVDDLQYVPVVAFQRPMNFVPAISMGDKT